jgi:uncharacterized protein (DUF4415 family)
VIICENLLFPHGRRGIVRSCDPESQLISGAIMPNDRHRRAGDPRKTAEAAFKAATSKPPEGPPATAIVPGVKEMVSLRLDKDVLEHFQADGPGWQDRINAALRKAARLS